MFPGIMLKCYCIYPLIQNRVYKGRHTHPHTPTFAANYFSGYDLYFSFHHRMPGFLVTGSGAVKRTEPVNPFLFGLTGSQTIWSNDLLDGSQVITTIIEDIFRR